MLGSTTHRRTHAGPRIGVITNNGASGKPNDDRYDYFSVYLGAQEELYVALVADGVASSNGGAQASEIAVRSIRNSLSQTLPTTSIPEWIEQAIHQAHREILVSSQTNYEWRSMCTTVVVGIIYKQRLFVAHLGDSRAYLVRNKTIHQLTRDHTWIQDALDQGRVTGFTAHNHPKRHIIKRFLGLEENINVDTSIISPFDNAIGMGNYQMIDSLDLIQGDALLFCTDGLIGTLEADEIRKEIVRSGNVPQKALDSLIQTALCRNEPDNITAILVKLPASKTPFSGWLSGTGL